MHTPAPLVSSDMVFAHYDLFSFGEIAVPVHPLKFGFQVDIVPSKMTVRQLVFGLVTQPKAAKPQDQSRGFAVKVDLETGEIWDLLNDSGLVGWISGLTDSYSEETPMLLSWNVEHLGSALIPRLQVGNDDFLYPAIHYRPGMTMNTIAGAEGLREEIAQTFLHPAVWMESL